MMQLPATSKSLAICLIVLAAAGCRDRPAQNAAGNDANALYGNEAPPPGDRNTATNTAANTSSGAADTYRAGGTEPFWSLAIGGGHMLYHPMDGADVSEALPAQTAIANGYKYVGAQMTVEVTHTSCNDGMSEETFVDTVHLTVGGQTLSGCGGQGDGVH